MNIKKALSAVRILLLGMSAFSIFFIFLMLTPIGNLIERGVNLHILSISNRFHSNSLTYTDKVECRVLYGGIILIGKVFFPEGSEMLDHYINGDGSDFYLDSEYLESSPVVIDNLRKMKVGQTKVVTFKQEQDWRLSYALNPFRIRKGKGKVEIWQEIIFLKKKDVYTTLNLGLMNVNLPDGLVHVLSPKKYTIRCKWNVKY